MQQLRLQFRNNQTYRLTLDFSQIDALYPGQLSTAVIRKQIAGFEWVTGGTAQGSVVYNPSTKTAVFSAPETMMAGIVGPKPTDIRVELSTGVFDVAAGVIQFIPGVTNADVTGDFGAGAGLGDTVVNLLCDTSGAASLPVTSDVITAILAQMAVLQAEVAVLQAGYITPPVGLSLDFSQSNNSQYAACFS